ncbi:MAG: isoaspartyl peptidase/L-asparaginase, partial [Myxococcota bacterium]
DAVEAAIMVMEDSPLFNAGKGAVFTHDGHNELDASVMDGATGKAGAVAGVRQVKNPIQAARAVMQASPHVMLSGAGADAFAAEQGLTRVEPDYFKTPMRWQQLQRALGSDSVALDHDLPPPGADKFGTVGAVAVDKQGHLAAATSTGGMTNKRWGRIGDSPIIGAGTYADDETCAVSATGHGEFFIREAVAHSVCARMAFGGASLPDAAHAVVFEQLDPTGGTGGIIAVDANGVMATPFNTPGMYRAHRFSDGTRDAFIWTAEHPREAQAHAASSEGGER